jgi:hypothetical protein
MLTDKIMNKVEKVYILKMQNLRQQTSDHK